MTRMVAVFRSVFIPQATVLPPPEIHAPLDTAYRGLPFSYFIVNENQASTLGLDLAYGATPMVYREV